MEHIQIKKNKILYLAKILKKEFPNLNLYIKIDEKNKKIFLRIKSKPEFEVIKKIESIVKVNFNDYFVNILVY